jgi:hypothetical protein
VVDIEADLAEIEAEEVHLDHLAAHLAGHLGVLYAVFKGLKVLCGGMATESTEKDEARN